MTNASTENTIYIVFVAIFVPLLVLTIINLIKHSRGKVQAYLSLMIFETVRIVGNALLVAAYEMEKDATSTLNTATITHLYTGGYVMQSIGYSMLFTATLFLFVSV
jgi:hypothetical protein